MRKYLLILLLLPSISYANECKTIQASTDLEYVEKIDSKTGKPTNFGVRTSGFVEDNNDEPVVHGIDVSKYQDETDFNRAYQCGAKFSYIRISGGTDVNNEHIFRTHWANARASGMLVGPYHNLSVLPKAIKRLLKMPTDKWANEIASLTPKAISSAKYQANLFIDNLTEVINLDVRPDPIAKTTFPSILPIALDISFDPFPNGSREYKKIYSPIYSAMVCTWIQTIEIKVPKSKVILFISPEIYDDYLNQNSCKLNERLKWLKDHTKSGGKQNYKTDSKTKEFCIVNNNETCIFQQYTSFGGFAIYDEKASLDLNRFYGSYDSLKSYLFMVEQ